MKLTGKCKEAFLEYYWQTKIKPLKIKICKREDLEEFFGTISELFQNALIIDFFDSVGIYIIITIDFDFCYNIYEDGNTTEPLYYEIDFSQRADCTTEAIKKANEIFNTNQ